MTFPLSGCPNQGFTDKNDYVCFMKNTFLTEPNQAQWLWINPFNKCCKFNEEEIGYILVGLEIVVFMILTYLLNRLEATLKDYIKLFKAQTIEMDDFALRWKEIPEDKMYCGNEDYLKLLFE